MLVKNKMKIFKLCFMLLDTCGRQETLIWDKHEDVGKINI